ncbi:hypothetical protein [Acidipropionibacterium virtanenii]|uniref:Uncharacterized protein n=1 Tax=Acidipropionibacterium virtanenii TaxID=2057246 RepID=A0A344URT4_9ACTN|nr:hypothetical protein [Acidipropionibacterium virtanenii]AXE37982.1 hypothetical protein JS278_00794 [Acidipropionibacterium virtanenii]
MQIPAGMWVILAVGLVLLIVAALADRRSRRHAEAQDAATPAGRPPAMSRDLCTRLDELMAGDHLTISATLASAAAATHTSPDGTPTAVVEDARVIVCPDALEGARVIQAVLIGNPDAKDLAVLAPSFDEFALGVILANHLHGQSHVIPVIADEDDRDAVTSALGSSQTSLQAIRSGWLPTEVWGLARLVVSDEISTTLVAEVDLQAGS